MYSQDQIIYLKIDVVFIQIPRGRQIGNSDKRHQFRELLFRLHDGKSTQSDWELLMMRIPEKNLNQNKKIF